MGVKPLYVVKIDGGYYSRNHHWQVVNKETATRFTHKEALRIRNYMKAAKMGGWTASIERL